MGAFLERSGESTPSCCCRDMEESEVILEIAEINGLVVMSE